MGIIIGVGGGRYSDREVMPIFEKIVEICGKQNPKVLFVPTAGFDDMDGDEDIFALFEELGASVSPLLLTDESLTYDAIEEIILSSDIVYAGGGNLKFLMDTWKKTGADKAFKKAYEKGVILSGYSSGSMCWFAEGYDDCGENHEFMFIECLGLLPYCNCPHYESDYWQPFKEAVKKRSFTGLAVENGAAYIWDNGKVTTMCGNDGGSVYLLRKENGFAEERLG
ncbi:MAG: Type 1 glutamine amidotransferase-like domain-containing protein [Clostridia bacterium]|nr:Type 1 glutamine amidotransferase-like domain-containing protein [Clostridia bacterium]